MPAPSKVRLKYAVTSGLKSTITVTPRNGKKIKITTLNHEQALNAIKVDGQLLITTATVLPTAEGITLQQLGNNAFDYILYLRQKDGNHKQCRFSLSAPNVV